MECTPFYGPKKGMLTVVFHLRTFTFQALVLSASWLAQAQSASQTPTQPQPSPEPAASPLPAVPSVLADSRQLDVVYSPQPDYPLEAAAKRLQGKVWIRVHTSESGDVASTEIMSGDPLLAKAAESAMRLWKFKPFIKDGKPVRVSKEIPYEFVLRGKAGDACATVEAVERMNVARHQEQVQQGVQGITQGVMEGSLIHRVSPEYPMIARAKHVQGTVILQATIGKDGYIHDLKPLCGPPELIPSSVDAVKQWRYRPYLLQGNPTDVETTIKVQFRM